MKLCRKGLIMNYNKFRSNKRRSRSSKQRSTNRRESLCMDSWRSRNCNKEQCSSHTSNKVFTKTWRTSSLWYKRCRKKIVTRGAGLQTKSKSTEPSWRLNRLWRTRSAWITCRTAMKRFSSRYRRSKFKDRWSSRGRIKRGRGCWIMSNTSKKWQLSKT